MASRAVSAANGGRDGGLAAGERVYVFYKTDDDDSYMPVDSLPAACRTPRIGLTHGWVRARVTASVSRAAIARDPDARVPVRFEHERWVDRTGEMLDPERRPQDFEARVPPSVVLAAPSTATAAGGGGAMLDAFDREPPPPPPALSVVVVRWGAPDAAPAYEHGAGGWGPTGSAVSDRYVNLWLRSIDAALGLDRDARDTCARVAVCLLYTSPSPRDGLLSRMPSSA